MFDYIQTMHMGLKDDQVIKLAIANPHYSRATIRKTDEIWNDNDGTLLIIESEKGEREIVNLAYVTFVFTDHAGNILC